MSESGISNLGGAKFSASVYVSNNFTTFVHVFINAMCMFDNKYHLPHNAVVVDEFNQMLNSLDLSREFYTYKELRSLFLQTQIATGTLSMFHRQYDFNLKNHNEAHVRNIYAKTIDSPSKENIEMLLDVQYTSRKTFKQVWNETVRDYTEFFAFLGLLPTYYKGHAGGENRHYISSRLKGYLKSEFTLEDLLLDFKFRNASKNDKSYEMYSITVRPFVVALKALKYFFDRGFDKINKRVVSAIVIFANDDTDESVYQACEYFPNPALLTDLFSESTQKELSRASTFLCPYLKAMGYVDSASHARYYLKGDREIDLNSFPKRAVYCGTLIESTGIALTPEVGQILYHLLQLVREGVSRIPCASLYKPNIDEKDREFLTEELERIGCISFDTVTNTIEIKAINYQLAINPFTDFYSFSDSNYVNNEQAIRDISCNIRETRRYQDFEADIAAIEPIANGSNGAKYEEAFYNLLKKYFPIFNITWYGQSRTGQRFSDMYMTANILDEDNIAQKIAIIIECKAGNAIKAFDERKEADDIKRTLKDRVNDDICGVWYWIVDSTSLPSIDSHGGYRANDNSFSFIEKLNHLQYTILANKRIPSLVTAFSFKAIKDYLMYLYAQISNNGTPIQEFNSVNTPHFWVWSKKFMHLQYVQVYKEWR